jgi:Holliday junction resolvasome RuvABC ATP-dependent DNA helicase subunit
MAWNFRRRIKILPGVHLNVGKKGVSTTFGVRGASITTGRNGVYLNTGIPGTGLYNRQKISGKKNNTNNYTQFNNNNDMSNNNGCLTQICLIVTWIMLIFTVLVIFAFSATWGVIFAVAIIIVKVATRGKDISNKQETITETTQTPEIIKSNTKEIEISEKFGNINGIDPLFDEVARLIVLNQQASTSFIQRQFSIGYNQAGRIIDQLEAAGIVSTSNGINPRQVLLKSETELNVLLLELQAYHTKKTERTVDIDSELTDIEKERFLDLCEKFSKLMTCEKIWAITSRRNAQQAETIAKQEITFFMGNLKGFKTSFKVPIIKSTTHTEYYIYPRFIVKKELNDIEKISIEAIDISFNTVRVIEDLSHEIHIANLLNKPFSYEENLPRGTKIIDYKYKHTNKDGTPNLRHSFNPRIPIVEYGKIKFEPLWLNYYFVDIDKAEQFVRSFQHLQKKTSNEEIERNIISQNFFDEVNKTVCKMFDLYIGLKNNKKFMSLIQKFGLFEKDKDLLASDLFMMDILTCHAKVNEKINLDAKSNLGLLLWIVKTNTDIAISQPNQLNIYKPTAKKLIDIYLNKKELYVTVFPNIDLLVADLLSDYTELRSKYLISLYRFASIMAKADNKITEAEQNWLSQLLNLGDDRPEEKIPEEEIELQPRLLPKPKNISKLKSLIGLASVKEEIETLTNFIKIQQAREAKGLKTSSVSYHCVFMGNPGTGKTTVARIVADIYKSLGILTKGHLVETDRSGLVAEYVGQTAVKTNKIIDSALDGVLFIDEAYSLISNSQTDYGKEAIATLLKRMEDNRDRLIVILAGYSSEMQQFIDSNPGLQSRFNRYIEFPDYSAEELYQIFEKNAKEFDYKISKDAEIPLKEYFTNKVANKDKNFGNARFVRNLFEKTIERQANRLSKEVNLTDEKLSEICSTDISI